ncbi:TIGR03943 family protein [Leptolyngbya sp. FACHB-261]|nr:TIGR03943 family protein [Leptolyngbya sp. FACHB-261]
MSGQLAAPGRRSVRLLIWLDVLVLLAWGLALLRFWLMGRLPLFIHPNYIPLVVAAGLLLLVLSGIQGLRTLALVRLQAREMRHTTLLPPQVGSGLLLSVALIALVMTPRPFTSDTALQRGVSDTLSLTRPQPQAFRISVEPSQRTLLDWIRTLNVYPEPDAYTGQAVKVQGFVVYEPNQPNNYLTISRFVITCCAADAYPVGLPVKLAGDRSQYPKDSWFEVTGNMVTESLNQQRQLVIQASAFTPIPEPANPYMY